MQNEPEHRFSGAFDPFKYVDLLTLEEGATCDCGESFKGFVYQYGGKAHCLSCAIDAAGIERRMIRP